ncbi:MAG TPA: zinc ribbon domain-containing protein [Gemmatimonadales bacterium]|jgi:hypothetical protein|nr:zinc ribbon domain-containing protein [Gemmatimonadales bacterium]
MNVWELVAGVLLALGAVWYVMGPVLRPAVAGRGTGDAGGEDEAAGADDDLSPRATALRALKEIEFDRATGKLGDADYEELKQRYTTEALAALRGEEGRGTGDVATVAPAGSRLPAPGSRVCPDHGPAAEPDAVFCSTCGRRLGGGPGFCSRCGTALEAGASFCNACGVPVAA